MPSNRRKKAKSRSKPKGSGQSSVQLGSAAISNQSAQVAGSIIKPVDLLSGSFAITGPISTQELKTCVTVSGASGSESVNFQSYRYASPEDIAAFEQQADRDLLGLQTISIMRHLILEYWLSAFLPVNLEGTTVDAYRWLIEAVEGRCDDFSTIFSQDVTKMLSEESRIAHLFRRFVKGRDHAAIENIWEVPKIINMTEGVSHYGQDRCNFQVPFWLSDDFFLHGAGKNRLKSYSDSYVFAWVDCMDIPLHYSRYQDHVIKHVVWAMQAYIDNPKKKKPVRGGALILSGVPSQTILEWFMCSSRSRVKKSLHGSGGDRQEITSIPDIEVFLAVPVLAAEKVEGEDIASSDVYFCVKSGINPGLDCRNQIAYQGSYQCLQDKHGQLSGEELAVLLQNALLHYNNKSVPLPPYSVKNDLSDVCDARQTLYNCSQPVVISSHGEADNASLLVQPRKTEALKKFYAAFWHYRKSIGKNKQPQNKQRQPIPENALLTVNSFFDGVSENKSTLKEKKAKKNRNRRKSRAKKVMPEQDVQKNGQSFAKKCSWGGELITHHYETVRRHALGKGGYYPDWDTITQDTCNENFYHNQEFDVLSLSNLSEHLDELNGCAFWLLRPVIFRYYSDGVLRLDTPRCEQLSIFYDTSDDAVKWLRYVQLFLENLVILMMQVIPQDSTQQKSIWEALMCLEFGVADTPILSSIIEKMVQDMIAFLKSGVDMQEPFFCTSCDAKQRHWFMLSDLNGPAKAKKDEALAILKKASEVKTEDNLCGLAGSETFQGACAKLNEVFSSLRIPFVFWLNQVSSNLSKEGSSSCVDTHARPEEARTLLDATDDEELVGALQIQDCTIGGFYDFSYVPENIIKCIFVLTIDGDMKIAQEFVHSSKRRISHVQLAEGRRVHTAGEMFFLKQQNQWVLHVINNGSGHYRPGFDSLFKPELEEALDKMDARIDQSATRRSLYHTLYGYTFCQNRDALDSCFEDDRAEDNSHVPKITV